MNGRPRTTDRHPIGGLATRFVALSAALALVLSACGTTQDDAGAVSMARANWSSGFMQAAIYAQLITELGYEVTDPAESTIDPNAFYPALGTGQYDLWANGWFPLHDLYLTGELLTGQEVELPIEPVGYQVAAGALQGYMIDKATADSMGITQLSDLQDPSVAQAFDHDGDGLADLFGCNKGWGCNQVIDAHLAEFGLSGTVEQVAGDYSELIRGVQDAIAAGESVLFYAWTPNWTFFALPPGRDVIWLHARSMPGEEGMSSVPGLQGCAWDPCNLAFPVSSIRAVGNSDFLDDNPQIRRLLERVTIPLSDIAAQNAKMSSERSYSEEQIQADALEWIASNRSMVDTWLADARAAG